MLPAKLYSPANVTRARYAQIGVAILVAAVCGYLAITTVLSVGRVWTAQRQLRSGKTEAAKLSRQAARMQRQVMRESSTARGGVEAFAARLSGWARTRGLQIESIVPEGSPTPTDVTVGRAKLGVWNASGVRVLGRGQFLQLMDLLTELREPRMPVELQSFALQRSSTGKNGTVSFDLLIKVYEKKPEAG